MISSRRGFTLIELLVVITIIALLTSFLLGAIFVSQEAAREARTKSTIARLHNLVMLKWESYRTRRLAVTLSGTNTQTHSSNRLTALRDLMRVEMPDCYADLAVNYTPGTVAAQTGLRRAYLLRLPGVTPATTQAALNAIVASLSVQNESAECFCLFITLGLTAEERGDFKSRDVGDTDNDGMPEILDGWQRPIAWLRWAPGFVSDLQPDSDPPPNGAAGVQRETMQNHDPFDTLRLQDSTKPISATNPTPFGGPAYWGYALTPLIVSAGTDGVLGLYHINPSPRPSTSGVSPYAMYSMRLAGEAEPDASGFYYQMDNIHNHDIGMRLK